MSPMTNPKRTVYVLRSVSNRTRYYTGLTSDWRARLNAHNSGKCPHTASGRPWIIDVVAEFTDGRRAMAFERYLKSGSGVAFAKRHLRSAHVRDGRTAFTRTARALS
jgi:putative endonuclease